MKLKNKYRFLVAWTLFNTFLTPDKLTDLVQINPANLRKKDVKNPLSYRYHCITQWTLLLVVEAKKIQLIKIRKEEPF